MNRCPKCNESTITNFQKINLGPLTAVECPNCHADISMPWSAALYKLAFFTFMIFIIYFNDLEFMEYNILLVSIVGLDSYIRYKFVPLIVKNGASD